MGEIVDFNHVQLADRPLLISDVDDVVLEFLVPFEAYLDSLGHRLLPKSFRLHGNIVSAKDQLALDDQIVTDLLLTFFEKQEEWQTPFGDAVAVLQRIGKIADIVFLTAMPPPLPPSGAVCWIGWGWISHSWPRKAQRDQL